MSDLPWMLRPATLCLSALVMLTACGRVKPLSVDGGAGSHDGSVDGAADGSDGSIDGSVAPDEGPRTEAGTLAETGASADAAVVDGNAPEAPVDGPSLADASTDGADAHSDAGRVPYRAIAVATGEVQTCALLDDHQVKCWGDNSYGELGYGDERIRGGSPGDMGDALPTLDLGTGRTAVAIAAGRYSTCAILDDGSLRCWGWAGLNGLGSTSNVGDEPGEMGDHLVPVDLGGRKAVRLAMGEVSACASTDDDTIWCWYEGDKPWLQRQLPVKPVRAFGPAESGVIAVYDDGTVSPVLPGGTTGLTFDRKVVAVAGGASAATCVLFDDATTTCTRGTVLNPGPADVVAIANERPEEFCAARSNGTVTCRRQLCTRSSGYQCADDGSFELGAPIAAITSNGSFFSCALLVDGNIKCWGPSVTVPWLGAEIDLTQTDAGITYGAWRPVDLGTHF